MRYPLIICRRHSLIVVGEEFFPGIGRLDEKGGRLEMNVNAHGEVGFRWIVDADASFFGLTSQGMLPPTALQRLRIARRRELFLLAAPRPITAGELLRLSTDLHDENPDFPNVEKLTSMLSDLPPDTTLTRAHMLTYLGE